MKIRVFTNILNDLMGVQSDLDLPQKESTLREVLDHLTARYGERVRQRIFVKEEIAPYVTVMVNGSSISSARSLEILLHEGDRLSLLTALVAGG